MIFDITKEHVKLIGRTYYYKEALWCGLSGSGIAFTFIGTKAKITLVGDNTTHGFESEGKARVGIYVDGVRVIDTMMEQPEKTFTVYESEEKKQVTIQIIKLSECAMSTVGIKQLDIETINGISPVPEKSRKIEFIGDSITCGYGVDLEDPETSFSTEMEDVTKAYAYKTASNLDADYSMVSFSGYGIISGFTDIDEKETNELVPAHYEKVGFSYAKPYGTLVFNEIDWNFNEFQPDIIVINLGTNDDSYCKDVESRQVEFSLEYVKFLETVRKNNPKAMILCTVGIMGERIFKGVQNAVEQYKAISGDEKIDTMKFTEQLPEDGLCSDSHPTEKTHSIAATVLTQKIFEIMSW